MLAEPHALQKPDAFRRLLLAVGVLAIVVCAGLVVKNLFRGNLNAPLDFTAFWVAGHLVANGENPYDPVRVRELQQSLGLDSTAIVVWNPPWALTLVMPIGVLPFREAFGVWVLVNLALIMVSAELLWRGFGGKPGQRWIAYMLTLLFVPTAFLLGSGQITAVVLFGLARFVFCTRMGRPVLAGAFVALTAVKPHLLALFALWLLLEAGRSANGRKVVLAGLVVGLLACVPPTLANPGVWEDYLRAVAAPSSPDHHHLSDWAPPLLGWWLRQAVPGQPFWVQWIPLVIAVGFIVWFARNPRPEGSVRLVPWLVGFSLLVAPYGVWQHDLILLLVPTLAVAVRVAEQPDSVRVAVGLVWFACVNVVSLVMMLEGTSSCWYVWVVPCVLLGCAVVPRLTPRAVFSPRTAGT
jgi:Glycosyltransferase family 87